MTLKIQNVKFVDVSDWDSFITEVYWKPYNFQQQDWCKDRWTYGLNTKYIDDYYEHKSIPFEVNWEIQWVRFDTWLKSDKEEIDSHFSAPYLSDLFWNRNFYPHIEELAKDLLERWLLDEWDYIINIDW